MTIQPPEPGEPRRPHGPRNPGDAWVVAPDGTRYWGRFGAAGLLAFDAAHGVLLQHRVDWSHFGGTWALPGGALHEDESRVDGALREAAEEAGVPADAVRPRLVSVLDLGYWAYSTVVADVTAPFEPVISDPESVELSWVPVDEVASYPLHPAFEAAWERLRALLPVRPTVIVDAANVVGAVPDGWWHDRAGAASRLLEKLTGWGGVPGTDLGLPAHTWFPRVVVVLEGKARDAVEPASERLEVVRATGSGDDEIGAQAARALELREQVTVVTSDRGLADRVSDLGASARGARWLLDRLG
ncbi:MAG: NUDIX hydrolase [Microbacterium sp.]|uniref:NUDIX domain-containing protein n=1 Tax=Microbacterium sp. TaxID=51671 RepID=UPI0039E40D67